MIAVVDYGVGNLFSLCSSLAMLNMEAVVSGDAAVIHAADKILLPGVGAFSDAIKKLRKNGLDEVIKTEASAGKPILGICLGMQMLFEKSLEDGEHEGLSLIPGVVRPIADVIPPEFKIPHIGWNSLRLTDKKNPLFRYIKNGDYVYFVHSYYAAGCHEYTIAATEYGALLTAAVARDHIFGCQFHPEKSGEVGLSILRAFCEL